MDRRLISRWAIAATAVIVLTMAAMGQSNGETIIDEWYQAKLPPPPQLKPVTLDAKTTALLVMDFTVQTCTQVRRPRCAASVPKVKKFVEEARGKAALIIYSVAVPKSVPGDI
jgi:hypothetical protein